MCHCRCEHSVSVLLLLLCDVLIFLFNAACRRAHLAIESGLGSLESKTASRKELRKLFGSIAIRAVIIAFVHARTSMLPPLLVSSTLAAMSVLENEQCAAVLVKNHKKAD